MFIVNYRKFFYALSLILVVISVYSMFNPGFTLGIDFTGGSLTEVRYTVERPEKKIIEDSVAVAGFSGSLIQPIGQDRFSVRTKELTGEQRQVLIKALSKGGTFEMIEERSTTVGPSVGSDLTTKAYIAIGVVVLLIVLFVTFAFRTVSEPVQSWKYGLATIVALAHDVVLPTGAFIVYAQFFGGEIDMLFVSALLAILGFSVHDTIVVFDRVRESLRIQKEKRSHESFEEIVGGSVSQTMGRSINTSLTTFIVLAVLYVLGPDSTKHFTFTLIAGIVAGTYSSIFIASPLLVTFYRMGKIGKNK